MIDDKENFLQILLAVNLRIQFGNAVYKTTILVATYFSMDVLIGTRFMDRHLNFNRCIDQQVQSIRGKRPLLESPMNVPTVPGLEFMDHEYRRLTRDKPTKKM